MEKILKEVPGATDVVADRIVGKPYIEFRIDREKIARYGVNIRDVQDVIEIAIGGENLTTSVEGRERYPIRVRYPARVPRQPRGTPADPRPGGQRRPTCPSPKSSSIGYTLGPQEIKSENTRLVGYVTMNTRDRDEVSVVEDADKSSGPDRGRRATQAPDRERLFPAGYHYQWGGQFENQVRAMNRLKILVPLCLLVDFVLLYIGLKRWWIALLVFSDILVSASGGFIMLLLWGCNISVAVWVGFIALFGVAEDDSVVVSTYIGDLLKERPSAHRAGCPRPGDRSGHEAHPAQPDGDRDHGHWPDPRVPGRRPRVGRDAAHGDPLGRRHGRGADHAVRHALRVLLGRGVESAAGKSNRVNAVPHSA